MSEKLSLKRRAKGHSIIELGILSVLFAVVAIFCVDVCFMLMASQVNERACRDAARAAAQADNYLSSLQLAQAAVASHKADGNYVSSPAVDASSFVYQDFGGNNPASVSPFVSVTTTTNIRVPAPVFFMGQNMGPDGTMQFTKTYTFPIVKTKLYL